MKNERAKVMEALRLGIQMESEGKEFYQKASKKSSNELARKLFQNLAAEEEIHGEKFEQIYQSLTKGQNWPDVEPPSEKGKRLKSVLAEATKKLGSKTDVAKSELEAIKVAIDMEVKTYNFYHSQSDKSMLRLEKQFYQALAAEEREHHLALQDSYEYLTDPMGWFVMKEHRLDAG